MNFIFIDMSKLSLKQLMVEIIGEDGLKIASKFWYINQKGQSFPVGKSEYGHSAPRDMINSGFILAGISSKSDRKYMEMVYKPDTSPSVAQWKAVEKLAKELGTNEIHDAIKKRTVWLR